MMRRLLFRLTAAGWLIAGTVALISAGSVSLQAELAQWLMAHAWDQGEAVGNPQRPWPWSDHRVVARLGAVELDVHYYVLDSDHGSALAHAPGLAAASKPLLRVSAAGPTAMDGALMISGHRDTHFRFVGQLTSGDALWLQLLGQPRRLFRVVALHVVDTRLPQAGFVYHPGELLLATCYPIDAWAAGGPLRLVARAIPIAQASQPRNQSDRVALLE